MRLTLLRPAVTFTSAALAVMVAAQVPAWAATPADTFVVARNTDDALTLDPHAAFEVSVADLVRNVYQRLFKGSVDDPSKLVGELAESWSLSEDGLTLEVKIRPGQFFSSGNPVEPEDVVYSLRRAVKLKKPPAFMLDGTGWTSANVDGLVTLGKPGNVLLKTTERLAPSYLQSVLSTSVSSIVDRKTVAAHDKDGDMGSGWLNAQSAGSGPYRLAAWKPREVIVLEASQHYGGKPAKLKRVVVRHVGEPTSQRLLLEKGDVDAASNLSADQLSALAQNKNIRVDFSPNTTVYYLGLNQSSQVLRDPKVWQAFRYLVDYDGIANSLLKGQLTINQGLIGQGMPGALQDQPFSYDPEKAKKLLADAGYGSGFSLSFDVPSLSPYNEVGQAMVQSFAKGGVQLTINSTDIKQVLTRFRARSYETILFTFAANYSDPHASADFFLSNPDNSDASSKKNAAWRLKWEEVPEYRLATAKALSEPDETTRFSQYRALQEEVRRSSPFVLAFQANQITGLAATVHGYRKPSAAEVVRYDTISKGL